MMWVIWPYLLAIVLFLAYCFANAEYKAVRKYYPGMTFWEYYLLQDRIRITPDRD